jgi:hypothetical protein
MGDSQDIGVPRVFICVHVNHCDVVLSPFKIHAARFSFFGGPLVELLEKVPFSIVRMERQVQQEHGR